VTALSLGAEICTYLAQQSLPTALTFDPSTAGGNLFATYLPDEPDIAVAVIERPGMAPDRVLYTPQSRLDKPSIQVMVRAGMTDFVAGNSLTQAIFGALDMLAERILNPPNGAYFHLIRALNSPAYLGIAPPSDTRQRHMWSINFLSWYENDQW
jgi:hypothetical protein